MGYSENRRQTVEQQIAATDRQIARQLEIVDALRSRGYPTAGAERQLDYLRQVLERRKSGSHAGARFRLRNLPIANGGRMP